MKPRTFMLIAGEASGDTLAAELVVALRRKVIASSLDQSAEAQPLRTALVPRFIGAGGPKLAAAGVDLVFDLTQHSMIGISEVLKHYFKLRRLFYRLLTLAVTEQPDVIIGVDYGGFNLRFGKAIKNYVRRHHGEFVPWNPRIVQFVSPQVWASRPDRAFTLAENYDLLLSIFPFEKAWYTRRAPQLRVEFVGHPMVERIASAGNRPDRSGTMAPSVVLLPGSRKDEVRRHWPVVTATFELMRRALPALRGKIILPNDTLARSVGPMALPTGLEVQVGGLTAALAEADLAIAKSGSVTMECAALGVPTVVFYKTSWPTYAIARQIINVPYIAMPNLLAGEEIFPEFIQANATPENLARAAQELLRAPMRREAVQLKLKSVIASLGRPGAAERAADAILSLRP